jgi:hypothetical protein
MGFTRSAFDLAPSTCVICVIVITENRWLIYIISGPLLITKGSRYTYLDSHPDVRPTLIVFGRLAVQPCAELAVLNAEG